jgi:hypothetical protein
MAHEARWPINTIDWRGRNRTLREGHVKRVIAVGNRDGHAETRRLGGDRRGPTSHAPPSTTTCFLSRRWKRRSRYSMPPGRGGDGRALWPSTRSSETVRAKRSTCGTEGSPRSSSPSRTSTGAPTRNTRLRGVSRRHDRRCVRAARETTSPRRALADGAHRRSRTLPCVRGTTCSPAALTASFADYAHYATQRVARAPTA